MEKLETANAVKKETQEDLKSLSLNESIIRIRVELQNSKLKKTGKNAYAGFDYFNLSDFLPRLNELELKYGINDKFTIEDENGSQQAMLIIFKGDEYSTYKMPFKTFDTPLNKNGQKSMQDIQYLGAMNTYYKRYLYINAFGITDGEVIDGMDNNDLKADQETSESSTEKLASPKQIEIIKKSYQGENLTKLLSKYNVAAVEELTLRQAQLIIGKLIEAAKEKKGEN